MVAQRDSTSDQYILTVEVSPAEVDAGAVFALTCRVALPSGSDQSGLAVSIRDHDNAELAFAELAKDGEAYATDEILLKAPLTEGGHILRAVLVAGPKGGIASDMTSTEFPIVVRAHAMRLNVWGLPPAIVAGESFALKAGIKCSCGCNLAGRELGIFDAGGVQIGAGKLREDVWPGTSALYFTQVDGNAPPAAGNHRWEVRIPASGSGIPHAAGACAFDVRVVDAPDYEVTIEAFDAGRQTPISGARVVMHPYRAVTCENGAARLKVVKGNYKLLVSGSRYIATAQTIEVTDNVTVRAELALEPIIDPISYYT